MKNSLPKIALLCCGLLIWTTLLIWLWQGSFVVEVTNETTTPTDYLLLAEKENAKIIQPDLEKVLPVQTTTLKVSTESVSPPHQTAGDHEPETVVTRSTKKHLELLSLEDFKPADAVVYVNAFKANVRQLPDIDAPVIDQFTMGDSFARSGYGLSWSRVDLGDDLVGYILTDLVSEEIIYRPTEATTTQATTTLKATTAQPTTKKPAKTETGAASEATTEANIAENKTDDESDEFMLFARVISLEGHRPSGYDSYLSVASVIMNQVDHKHYPNTVSKVLSAPGRFSVYKRAAQGYPEKVSSAVQEAAYDAYYLGKRNLPSYVIAFTTPAAYEKSVASGGFLKNMLVYQKAYNAIWCYYERDAR